MMKDEGIHYLYVCIPFGPHAIRIDVKESSENSWSLSAKPQGNSNSRPSLWRVSTLEFVSSSDLVYAPPASTDIIIWQITATPYCHPLAV